MILPHVPYIYEKVAHFESEVKNQVYVPFFRWQKSDLSERNDKTSGIQKFRMEFSNMVAVQLDYN